MSDSPSLQQNLKSILSNRLAEDFDLDIVPVPSNGDPMVRLRTLEEALEEFEDDPDSQELQRYLIQIKPRPRSAPEPQNTRTQISQADGIYRADGTLNLEYLFHNAEILMCSGEYVLARNIYAKIAKAGQSATKTAEALRSLGRCFELEGQPESARAKYEESIAYHPMLESYQRLSTLLMNQKKHYQAAEALERALALKELTAKTRYEILKAVGNSWMRAGEMGSAEKAYKRALEIDPSADEIQGNLGALYLNAEKIAEARRRFEDALATNPRNDKALSGLGCCMLAAGDKRGAHDQFVRALEINIQNPQAIFHLVKCAYQLKTYAAAAKIVESYIQVAPVNINLLYSLAGLQFHLGRMTVARETCEKILELNPSHSGARELLGMTERF